MNRFKAAQIANTASIFLGFPTLLNKRISKVERQPAECPLAIFGIVP